MFCFAGVDTKITNVGISVKSTGSVFFYCVAFANDTWWKLILQDIYLFFSLIFKNLVLFRVACRHQGLSVEGNPKVFEQFVSQHQCNYFCGLLGLRSLKVMDSLLTPTKPKGSRSPLLQRKMAAGSSSPQTGRKAAGSPRLPRKAEQEGRKTPTGQKAADAPGVVKMA